MNRNPPRIEAWHVGASAAGNDRLDTAPRKAFFRYEAGHLPRVREFSLEDLDEEIEKLRLAGQKVPAEYLEAAKRLRGWGKGA